MKKSFMFLLTITAFQVFANDYLYVPVITPRGEMNGSGGCAGHGFPRTHTVYVTAVAPEDETNPQSATLLECRISMKDENTEIPVILHNWFYCSMTAGQDFVATDACADYSVEVRPLYRRFLPNNQHTDRYGRIVKDTITYYAD